MENFLYSNLINGGNVRSDSKYQDGVLNTELFDVIDNRLNNPIYKARFLYVKNLALKEPVPFEIPATLGRDEKALMYLSFNNFKQAVNELNVNMQYKVIGVEAKSRTGAKSNRFFIWLHENEEDLLGNEEIFSNKYNSNCREDDNMTEFKTESHIFEGLNVKSLENEELIFLYVKMKELCFVEENRSLLETKMCAMLERVFFEQDKLNNGFLQAFEILKSEFMKETRGLEKRCIVNENISKCARLSEEIWESIVSGEIFRYPIIFQSALEIQLGLSLMELSDYSAAYKFLIKYSLFKEKINCLIEMRNAEGAILEIQNWINMIEFEENGENRIVLSNLYIKLGHLTGDVSYFDKAAEAFNSNKPHKVKGLWMYRKKRYVEAEVAFSKALEITGCDEETRYLYAHTLMFLKNYRDALRNFKMVEVDKIKRSDLSRSISFCYYKIGELEESLKSLKSAALEDSTAMNQYVVLSMRNGFIENIKWALKRMSNETLLSEVVNYILQYKILLANDLFECLSQNQNLTTIDINRIISNCTTE